MIQIEHTIKENTEDLITYNNIEYYPLVLTLKFDKTIIEIPSRLKEYLKLFHSKILRTFQGDTDIIKIILNGYFSKNIFEKILTEKLFPFYTLLEDEKNILKEIFNIKGINFFTNSKTSEILDIYIKYTTDITDIFDKQISLKYQQEIREIFTDSLNKEHEKRIFAITDFLIHFINWNTSFYYFYDSATEIIPGIIHSIEPRLSYELRTTIRAYRVYFTKINIIKKILDKREKGKIITISYLDWKKEVKEFLFNSFTEIFGEKVALEYIESLEKILIDYLK